ncbi:MAG: hypothetical protein QG597_4663, partial [Actinomycetota bacterium]|nr:hypothetical protein [Actinomycetota bacterium]
SVTPDQVLAVNPNTGTLPLFQSRMDADITIGIYRRHPVLIRDGDPDGNPWGLSFTTMFHMANDSGLFHTAEELDALGARFDGWAWELREEEAPGVGDDAGVVATRVETRDGGDQLPEDRKRSPSGGAPTEAELKAESELGGGQRVKRWLPLYEAKMLNRYDHRFATYANLPEGFLGTSIPKISDGQHNDPNVEPLARYWVEESEVDAALADRSDRGWLLGWRDIARASDVRTMVPCAFPRSAVGNKFPVGFASMQAGSVTGHTAAERANADADRAGAEVAALLLAVWSSLVFDYIARQKLSGTGMTYFILKQLACPRPEAFDARFPASSSGGDDQDRETNDQSPNTLRDFIIPRVLELTYTSHRMAPFARDLGYDGPPFRWKPDHRALIQAELDALMMHVYGLTCDEVEHVLDSFPVLRKYEERDHGEFRTRRLILDSYAHIAAASEFVLPIETLVMPPSGCGPRDLSKEVS